MSLTERDLLPDAVRPAPVGLLDGRRAALWGLALVLALAAALRLPLILHDLPFSYYGDELHFVKMSVAMGTGDLNPHWFHKPAFLMYLLLAVYGVYFMAGAALGQFASPDAFGAHFLADMGPFLLLGRLVVALFSIAMVYVTWRLARRLLDSTAAALAAALICAVLMPVVSGSDTVKEDVPAAFFLALALLAYAQAEDSDRPWPLVLAAVAAGLSMAVKYYGIVMVPILIAAELLRIGTHGMPWRRALGRAALVPAVFVATFFVASPYNFLDPTWSRELLASLQSKVLGVGDTVHFDPDNGVEYSGGLATMAGAALHFLGKLVYWQSFGWTVSALALVGALVLARTRPWRAALLFSPLLVFMAIASAVQPYHVNPRHLISMAPLMAVLAAGGALALARAVARGGRAPALAVGVTAAALLPNLALTVGYVDETLRLDSRTVAQRWIVANIPAGAPVLLDDYGPLLLPDAAGVRRLQAKLAAVPDDEGFTRHQGKRLELMARHPVPHGYDLTELGHQWWNARELSDAELRADWKHRDMSSPIVDRVPVALDAYRERGIRYVVTNTDAADRYAGAAGERNFPSFARFYRELAGLTPIHSVDPAQWGGAGPVVRIYDLGAP